MDSDLINKRIPNFNEIDFILYNKQVDAIKQENEQRERLQSQAKKRVYSAQKAHQIQGLKNVKNLYDRFFQEKKE